MIKLRKYINGIFGLLILLGFIVSCTQTNKVQVRNPNLSDIYNPSRSGLHPDYSVHNINDSSTLVYLRIFPSELLFSEANEERESRAKLMVSYSLFHYQRDNKELSLTDSASYVKVLYKDEVRNSYFSAIPLKAFHGLKYIVNVTVKDLTRGSESRKFLVIDRNSKFNGLNFRVLAPTVNYPTFSKFFLPNQGFRLQFNQFGYDSINVDYYSSDRPLPRPIFSAAPEIQMKTFPDSSWRLPYNDTMVYNLPIEGIYLFKMNKEDQTGCALYNFGENYPRTQSADDLMEPLVYLASTNEFRDLRLESNRKLAIDNYWLKMTNDMDDARELIRVYYNRVLYSNLYFPSYKEGWKTDRGMIYIVFGPPDILEKSTELEIWKYRTRKTNSMLEFRFDRKDNLFSDEDYQLDRSGSSTSIWLEAVQSWKKGRIYSADY